MMRWLAKIRTEQAAQQQARAKRQSRVSTSAR
jgi:hypothetical protein